MRTSEQVLKEQNEQAEAERSARLAKARQTALAASTKPKPAAIPAQADLIPQTLPAKTNNGGSTAVAVPDNCSAAEKLVDDIAPATTPGPLVKFDSKSGTYKNRDTGDELGGEVEYTILCDQTLSGWIKFNGEGNPPDRVMGLPYDGWRKPERETLGDNDRSNWDTGLDGTPADPWQEHLYLVLQSNETKELLTFVASAKTHKTAVGNLLRHYNRMLKTHPDEYPIVRLKCGGFDKGAPVGWVNTPVLTVVGRTKRDTMRPLTSAEDMSDEIPF
jgi:hypothetical protein